MKTEGAASTMNNVGVVYVALGEVSTMPIIFVILINIYCPIRIKLQNYGKLRVTKSLLNRSTNHYKVVVNHKIPTEHH